MQDARRPQAAQQASAVGVVEELRTSPVRWMGLLRMRESDRMRLRGWQGVADLAREVDGAILQDWMRSKSGVHFSLSVPPLHSQGLVTAYALVGRCRRDAQGDRGEEEGQEEWPHCGRLGVGDNDVIACGFASARPPASSFPHSFFVSPRCPAGSARSPPETHPSPACIHAIPWLEVRRLCGKPGRARENA